MLINIRPSYITEMANPQQLTALHLHVHSMCVCVFKREYIVVYVYKRLCKMYVRKYFCFPR